MKLTQGAIATLTLPPGKSELVVFDDAIPGFALRLRASGHAVWVYHYRHGALQRRVSIGSATALTATAARDQATKLYAQVKLGADPAGQRFENRARAGETFGAVAEAYLARQRQRLRPASFIAVEYHLRVYAQGLHRLPLTQIARRDIAALLTKTEATVSGASVNRLRASLSGFFSWAIREGLIELNPTTGTTIREELPRTRLLLDSEIAEIWAALRDDVYGSIVKLLILCGARRAELGALRPNEVELDRGLIVLPDARTKNHREHRILLNAPAIAILRVQSFDYRFVFGHGRNGYSDWGGGKTALDRRILENRQAANPKPEPLGFVLHDFRRYLSTTMNNRLNMAPHLVEAVLGHAGVHRGVSGVYNVGFPEAEVRNAMERWGEFVMNVVEGREHKVVPLHA